MRRFLFQALYAAALVFALALLCSCHLGEPSPGPTILPAPMMEPNGSPLPMPQDSVPAENLGGNAAMVLEGELSDGGATAQVYEGLLGIEELGAAVEYSQWVAPGNIPGTIRELAENGAQIIFLTSDSYEAPVKEIASEYPDVIFMFTVPIQPASNVYCLSISDAEQGYLMGVIAAFTTKTKQVGFIGGEDVLSSVNAGRSFLLGASKADPAVTITITNTGSFDDPSLARETALAMVNKGIDTIAAAAGEGGVGVMEAAERARIKCIASESGHESAAPTACVAAVRKDMAAACVAVFRLFAAQSLPTGRIEMGALEGAVCISDDFPGSSALTQDAKVKIAAIYDDLKSGKIIPD